MQTLPGFPRFKKKKKNLSSPGSAHSRRPSHARFGGASLPAPGSAGPRQVRARGSGWSLGRLQSPGGGAEGWRDGGGAEGRGGARRDGRAPTRRPCARAPAGPPRRHPAPACSRPSCGRRPGPGSLAASGRGLNKGLCGASPARLGPRGPPGSQPRSASCYHPCE
ncbi:unnamed protein product [Nyctereutes procyonoides]|uniref:(raccoon dog) hypothetical protein n=1 Tax=Nyctereutes procyonoides TaxID=34880 RepID=A0A811ZVW5_NYCPR|nr:unnamed protein product [Nyctereutes procyonoides]